MAHRTPASDQTTNKLAQPCAPRGDEAAGRIEGGARIAALNDAFRRTFQGGQEVETPGVLALHEAERISLLLAVRRLGTFDAGNGPHGEHDFGAVAVAGYRCFWKIDVYDRDLRGHSLDAADPAVTARVLTIMLAEEY